MSEEKVLQTVILVLLLLLFFVAEKTVYAWGYSDGYKSAEEECYAKTLNLTISSRVFETRENHNRLS